MGRVYRQRTCIDVGAPKNAMNRTMGKLAFTRKIGPAAGSLCGNCRPGSEPAERHSAGLEVTSAAIASSSASLRSVRTEMLKFPLCGGNDARWKTPKASFPPRLGIREKAPDSHIPTASTAASISLFPKLYRAPPHRIL
jgi:hypothetical protein